MTDIRKRTGTKGTTYQVRYPSKASASGYAYATFETRAEAKAFIESGKARRSSGLAVMGVSVPEAIDLWLDICEKEGRDGREPVSKATHEQYEYRSRIMKGYRWTQELSALEEHDIIAFRSWLLRNNSRDAAQKVLSSFHSVLIEMKKRRMLASDPAAEVSVEGNSRYTDPVQIPSVAEFREILRAADRLANAKKYEIARAWERYRPMIYLAADSGMRPQEYLVLPIDALDDRGVRVTQALDRSNQIGPPKTKAGRRFIPVSDAALDMVRLYADRNGKNGFVFPARMEGGYQCYNNYLRRGWHKLMEEAGLVAEHQRGGNSILERKYTPYALRHFYASMLIEQNRNLKYVQTVMGHEDIKMTFDVYGHIIKEREAKRSGDAGGILPGILEKSCGESVASRL